MELLTPATTRKYTKTNRKRFQNLHTIPQPLLLFDAEGNIVGVTPAALHMLGYRTPREVDTCFFVLIHSKNLYSVMRDVADMVCHGKRQSSWVLRLRKRNQSWRWFNATAYNYLEGDDGEIAVYLETI